MTMNLEQARYNMIEQQIRPWEVLDRHVLDIMQEIPREHFVPIAYKNMAFADIQIPLEHNQVMMEPKIEAKLLQALEIKSNEVILEIGTGSGYLTACLAKSGGFVHSIDIYAEFKYLAQEKLSTLDINNFKIYVGDAACEWKALHSYDPHRYDVIVMTGASYTLPEFYKHALTMGGRLFTIVGVAPVMEALLITRIGQNEWQKEVLFETCIPSLVHAEKPQLFEF